MYVFFASSNQPLTVIGRTPLHYACVVGNASGNGSEMNQYYEILKKAGANQEALDKQGHTAAYYLDDPGALTVRQLLDPYRSKRPRSGAKSRESSHSAKVSAM